MNDTELDQLLNAWESPAEPASMRENARSAFRVLRPRKIILPRLRTRFLLAAALGMGALVFVAQALPQTAQRASSFLKPPFTVDSEWVNSGAPTTVYTTSYMSSSGHEITLSSSIAHNHITAVLQHAHAFIFALLSPLLTTKEEESNAAELVKNGCVNPGAIVTGHETILGYPSVVLQFPVDDGQRATVSKSPKLACFPMKMLFEKQQPDGLFRLASERHALKVNLNP